MRIYFFLFVILIGLHDNLCNAAGGHETFYLSKNVFDSKAVASIQSASGKFISEDDVDHTDSESIYSDGTVPIGLERGRSLSEATVDLICDTPHKSFDFGILAKRLVIPKGAIYDYDPELFDPSKSDAFLPVDVVVISDTAKFRCQGNCNLSQLILGIDSATENLIHDFKKIPFERLNRDQLEIALRPFLQILNSLGVTQTQIGNAIGVSQSTVSRFLKGSPSPKNNKQIYGCFNINLS